MAILSAMVLKGLLTIITFGIKLPAGIFIPTLAVGACFGRIVGLLVQYVQWTRPELGFFDWCPASDSACIVPGVYAMVGAAAALSGVTRTTVSLAVIMFELTGTLTYSVPVMLSILVAKTIADALEHKGIYDLVIDFSGLPYLDSKTEYIWNGVNVTDATETEVEVICLDAINTVQSLGEKLDRLARGSGYTDGGFPIVSRVSPPSSSTVPASPPLSASVGSLADIIQQPNNEPSPSTSYQMVGYIAASELEHALTRALRSDPDMNARPHVAPSRTFPLSELNERAKLAFETLSSLPLPIPWISVATSIRLPSQSRFTRRSNWCIILYEVGCKVSDRCG